MAELLKIEGFATKEIALQQKPINEVLKESEGVLISFTKANVKKNLTALVKKHSKEIDELIAKDQLTTKEEARLKELRAIHKEPRIALDKITKHNSSVLAQTSKSIKVVKDELILIVEPTEDKITARLESEEKRRENARIEKENAEIERKAKLQSIVDVVASDLQSIINATDSFEKIEENEKQFNSILAVFDNSVEEKTIDLQDYDVVYQDMVLDKSEAFDSLIKSLTKDYELEQSTKALKVAELTNERMSKLFDYDFKFSSSKKLGEFDEQGFEEILSMAKKSFRLGKLENIGFLKNDELKSLLYVTETEVILLSTTYQEILSLTDLEFEEKITYFTNEIEDWNNPKEVEVNEIEVDLSEENKEVEQVEAIQENNENKAVLIDNSEFDKEAKENLENTISLEPKEQKVEVSKYSDLFNYLSDTFGALALESEMQEIERIVLKMQE